MFIARAVTIAPWVADFVKEEGAVIADKTDAQELLMHQPDEVGIFQFCVEVLDE